MTYKWAIHYCSVVIQISTWVQLYCFSYKLFLRNQLTQISGYIFQQVNSLPRSKSASETWAWAFSHQTILSGRECEHFFWITTSHYLNMTHPRCYSTSKGPLQLMWRPGNAETTGGNLSVTFVTFLSQLGKDWKCFVEYIFLSEYGTSGL